MSEICLIEISPNRSMTPDTAERSGDVSQNSELLSVHFNNPSHVIFLITTEPCKTQRTLSYCQQQWIVSFLKLLTAGNGST